MAGVPPTLPILKWKLRMEIDGELRRDSPIIGFTVKGIIRQSLKEWLINTYPELGDMCLKFPAPFLGSDKTIQLLRVCEASPSCPVPVKLKAFIEPVINLFGSYNVNASAAQKAGFSIHEYIPISMMMIPRLRIVLKQDDTAFTMTQGTMDNFSMALTSAPHTITIRRASIDATIYLVPSKIDYLEVPDIVEMLPKDMVGKGLSYFDVHRQLIDGTLRYLQDNAISIEALGGRSAHIVSAEFEGPEDTGKQVITRRIDMDYWKSAISKLDKYSIFECNRELLSKYGAPVQAHQNGSKRPSFMDW